jgi:hypothetical protein
MRHELTSPWQEHFSTNLQNLHNLTHLRLSAGRLSPKASTVWPGIHAQKDLSHHYAQLVESKSPSLHYIQINRWAWQVSSPIGALPDPDADIHSQIELRLLE